MLEESRDDEILLVGEMLLQEGQEVLDPAGESVGLAFSAGGLRKRRQQFACLLDRCDKAFVDELMIGFEQIEADNQALIQLPKLREVDVILDPVMIIEVLQEGIEPRNEGLLQLEPIKHLAAKGVDDPHDLTAFAAQIGMHMQPEVGQFAEVRMRSPAPCRV